MFFHGIMMGATPPGERVDVDATGPAEEMPAFELQVAKARQPSAAPGRMTD